MTLNDQIAAAVTQAIPDAAVYVDSPDGTHFQAVVVAASFEGMTLVKQHQAVMNALKAHFDTNELHALQLKTFTPARWRQMQAQHQTSQD